MPSDGNDDPRWTYDCERCKFSWCCGPTCVCLLEKRSLPNPPKERQDEVDAALVKIGLKPEFSTRRTTED